MPKDKNKNNLRFKITPLKTQWLLSGGVLVLGTTIAWIFMVGSLYLYSLGSKL